MRISNLELLAIHGCDFSLLANGKRVGHRLSWGLGGDDKVFASLFDLSNWLDVLGHLDDIFRELCCPQNMCFYSFVHTTTYK